MKFISLLFKDYNWPAIITGLTILAISFLFNDLPFWFINSLLVMSLLFLFYAHIDARKKKKLFLMKHALDPNIMPRYKFKETTKTIPVAASSPLNKPLVCLPDTTYGEWILLDGRLPKFYISIFAEDGRIYDWADYLSDKKLDFEKCLIFLAKREGFNKITGRKRSLWPLRNDDSIVMRAYNVLELVDE